MGDSLKEVPAERNNVKYHIIDTPGLNKDNRGTATGEDAEKNLEKLLRRTADHGLNLMIMITRGRISETLDKNYDMFVNTMTSNKVP